MTFTRRDALKLTAASLGSGAAWSSAGRIAEPAHWDPRKRFFFDDRIVERVDGLRLSPGLVAKDKRNPLFGEDKPWEVRIDNLYGNILYDREESIYKLWYNPFIVYGRHDTTPREKRATTDYVKQPKGDTEMGICYATSKDGFEWDKPELGMVDFRGSKRNNLILRARPEPTHWVPHGAGIWKDTGDPDPARRYKMFFCKPHVYQCVSFSADGLHWSDPHKLDTLHVRGDTHNNTFWAPSIGKYVGFTRRFDGSRIVTRTESEDFLSWSEGVDVLRQRPNEPSRQTYAHIAFPYGNLYLGLVMMLNRGEKMNREDPNDDTVDCELTWSPDTVHWERLCAGMPLIPRGREGGPDWGCIYGCAYPVLRDGYLRLYYGGNNGKHSDWRDGFLNLAYLRPDGFAGLGQVGSITMRPMAMESATLQVTADAPEGTVIVKARDEQGRVVAESTEMPGVMTNAAVQWKQGALARGRTLSLQFIAREAKLYSFRFA